MDVHRPGDTRDSPLSDLAGTVLTLLAPLAWLYLLLGTTTTPVRVLLFVAGYIALGVAFTGPRGARRSTERRSPRTGSVEGTTS